MTTVQLAKKIKKFFRDNGETSFPEITIPEMAEGGGKLHKVNVLCIEDGEIGVASDDYFFNIDELTWKELSKIKKILFK